MKISHASATMNAMNNKRLPISINISTASPIQSATFLTTATVDA